MMNASPHIWKRGSAHKKRMIVYLAIFVVTALLVLRVGAQMCILSLGQEIRGIQTERAGIEAEIADLEIRTANLRTGSRIKAIARDSLGMIVPEGAPQKLF